MSCSGHESALAALTSKVADELWQWYVPYASMTSEPGYFLPTETSDKLSPLIVSTHIYAGYTGGEREDTVCDVIFAPDVYLTVIKYIESVSREERVSNDSTGSSVLAKAKIRSMDVVPPVIVPYTEYDYDSCIDGPGFVSLDHSDYPHPHRSMPMHTPISSGGHADKSNSNGYNKYWFPATTEHPRNHTPSLLPGTPYEVPDADKCINDLQAVLLKDLQVHFSQSVRASVKRSNTNKVKGATAYLPPTRYYPMLFIISCSKLFLSISLLFRVILDVLLLSYVLHLVFLNSSYLFFSFLFSPTSSYFVSFILGYLPSYLLTFHTIHPNSLLPLSLYSIMQSDFKVEEYLSAS